MARFHFEVDKRVHKCADQSRLACSTIGDTKCNTITPVGFPRVYLLGWHVLLDFLSRDELEGYDRSCGLFGWRDTGQRISSDFPREGILLLE